jgi:probable F420-dependent oxidoreductase
MRLCKGSVASVDLGRLGVWWSGTWRVADDASVEVAGELEELGYTALWSSGGFQPGLSAHFERLLEATTRMKVCSGIVSVWSTSPDEIALAVADLNLLHPGRFVLGLGASHAPIVENYTRPYSHMAEYLDALDRAGHSVARGRRVLAALGPRMLRLAAQRAAGAHPYFAPVEHTARARETLGADALLAPEVTVLMEKDASTARQAARNWTAGYLSLANYANNLRSLGFGDDDLAAGGSDRLIDAVVAWGETDRIASRIREHLEAGANHVCIQVLAPLKSFPLKAYRDLAPALSEP